VVEVCQACLAKEPADRPDAAEVAEILAASASAITGGRPLPPVRPRRRARQGGTWSSAAAFGARRQHRQRRRTFAMAGAAAALVMVVTAAVFAATLVRPDGSSADGGQPVGDGAGKGGQAAASAAVGGATGGSVGPSGQPGSTRTVGPGATPHDSARPEPGSLPPTIPPASTPGGNTQRPGPVTASQSSYGNTITVQCTGSTALITRADPAEGWSVNRISPGPAEQVNVKFESAQEPYKVAFRSRCTDGRPRINLDNG
jgi:serine/threonine-protein kinase